MADTQKWPSKFYKTLQKFGIVSYSGKKNIYGLHPLIISGLVIIVTLILASILRKLVKLVLNENIVRALLLEFIATAELCACCFELIIVADNYGVQAYAVFLFLLTVWWCTVWEDATACPYFPLEEVLEGTKNITRALIIIVTQVLGGIVIFQYVYFMWSIELTETHIGRADEDCVADLAVPMVLGAGVEGVATFLCRIMSRILGETQLRYAYILDAFFATCLVVAAFNYSGGYFNPALATSLKFGCEGNDFVEHMIVYWVGATAGSIASVYFFKLPFIQRGLHKLKVKSD